VNKKVKVFRGTETESPASIFGEKVASLRSGAGRKSIHKCVIGARKDAYSRASYGA